MENKRWQPKLGEEYWCVNARNVVVSRPWNNSTMDLKNYQYYNCCKTEAEAKVVQESRKHWR